MNAIAAWKRCSRDLDRLICSGNGFGIVAGVVFSFSQRGIYRGIGGILGRHLAHAGEQCCCFLPVDTALGTNTHRHDGAFAGRERGGGDDRFAELFRWQYERCHAAPLHIAIEVAFQDGKIAERARGRDPFRFAGPDRAHIGSELASAWTFLHRFQHQIMI